MTAALAAVAAPPASHIQTRRVEYTEDKKPLIAALQTWKQTAFRLKREAYTPAVQNQPKCYEDMNLIHSIAATLITELTENCKCDRFYGAFVADKLQGMALLRSNIMGELEIIHLISRPENVSEKQLHAANKVRGVGRALVTHIVREMLTQDDARLLLVRSALHSTGFYVRCGFHKQGDPHQYSMNKTARLLAYDPENTIQKAAQQKNRGPLALPPFLGAEIISFLLPLQRQNSFNVEEILLLAQALYQNNQASELALLCVRDMAASQIHVERMRLYNIDGLQLPSTMHSESNATQIADCFTACTLGNPTGAMSLTHLPAAQLDLI